MKKKNKILRNLITKLSKFQSLKKKTYLIQVILLL